MIKFDGQDSYYLPSQSRNAISLYEIKNITKDDFKIKTKVKIDWDNLDMEQRACGIAVFNGMDMGIFCGIYEGQRIIMAQIWTDGKEKADMEEVYMDINDDSDIYDIEFDYQYQSGLTLKVNGEKRQAGNTSRMIFNFNFLVSHISQFMTLYPGTVITTGTPAGTAMEMAEPKFLQPGDKLSLKVDHLGEQNHSVIDEG